MSPESSRAGRDRHAERHTGERMGWLRAAVLGANDGVVSVAGLLIGVAAAGGDRPQLVLAGVAGLTAGAMSMAAGEYVSVSSQRDAERADLAKEKLELASDPAAELEELAGIYRGRGLDPDLARAVAEQLTRRDALGAHVRDELQITELTRARPALAAGASAVAFTLGAAIPLAAAAGSPDALRLWLIPAAALGGLAALGLAGAWAGGASAWRAALRVMAWSAAAMAVSAGVGRLVGVAV